MKTRRLPLYFITLLLVQTLFLANTKPGICERLSDSDDIEGIGNAIIIQGLKMPGDTPIEEGKSGLSNGTIIYDDTFDDAFSEFEELKNEKTPKGKKLPKKVKKSKRK